MNTPNISEDLIMVVRRMVWFEPPEQALQSPTRFLAHVMTYGTVADVVTAEKYFTPEDFRRALENAPPGVFDARSWAYWNTVFGRVPVPPLPRRRFVTDHDGKLSTED